MSPAGCRPCNVRDVARWFSVFGTIGYLGFGNSYPAELAIPDITIFLNK
jgi:hypothetical protein